MKVERRCRVFNFRWLNFYVDELNNHFVHRLIVSFPRGENRYVIYECSLRPILRITFASAALVILYTHVRGLLQEAFLTTSATPLQAHFNDRGLISSLGTRLGFRIGKVFANHADSARRRCR